VKAQIVFPESIAYNLPCSEWVWAPKMVTTDIASSHAPSMHETGDILGVTAALTLCLMRHEVLRSIYVLAASNVG
jgi:hypothetical protein